MTTALTRTPTPRRRRSPPGGILRAAGRRPVVVFSPTEQDVDADDIAEARRIVGSTNLTATEDL